MMISNESKAQVIHLTVDHTDLCVELQLNESNRLDWVPTLHIRAKMNLYDLPYKDTFGKRAFYANADTFTEMFINVCCPC